MEDQNKEKTFAEKLFHHWKKGNPPPISDRNLETQLEKERQKNKALRDELENLKSRYEALETNIKMTVKNDNRCMKTPK